MYGCPKFAKSKYGNNLLIHESGNKIYKFKYKKKFVPKKIPADQDPKCFSISYYSCNSCELLKNADKETYNKNTLP